MILAMVVERASGRTFDEFLRSAIFEPLEMNSTHPDPGPRGAEETKGDGWLVSTVDDLLKWDQALAGERLVRAKTFAEALVPAKVAEGSRRTDSSGTSRTETDTPTCGTRAIREDSVPFLGDVWAIASQSSF
jgi:CubicO group peptidase (beta-lactamase class C family)